MTPPKDIYIYNIFLETVHIENRKDFILSIYGQKELLEKSLIQALSIKLINIWMQVLVLHQYGILSQETGK